MSTRVIDDPELIGWELDPNTGRWMWTGGSGSGGGIEEAPDDGKLYGRQSKSWEEVPEGGPSTHVGPDAPDPVAEGQLWFNSGNGVLYVYYDNGGSPEWVATGSSGSGSGPSTHVGDTAPDSPVEGQLWLNTDDGYLYAHYDNAGNPTWMAAERES